MMKRRILFISQYFDPETFRGNDIAYHLAEKGYEVTVVCGTPNYPKGKFFKGYGWFKRKKETIRGVKVVRLPIIPRGSNSLMLALNYFSYPIVASLYVLAKLLFRRFDVCFVQQLSPVLISIPGVLFRKITGRPLVTWVLDLWPESLQFAGGISNRWTLGFFRLFVKSEYKNSDRILVSSKEFRRVICQYGDYGDKIQYFPQWSDAGPTESEATEGLPGLDGEFKAVFTGNVGDAQDFESIVEAVRLLDRQDGIRLYIVGDGRKYEWLREEVKRHDLSGVLVLLGRYPAQDMPYFMRNADVLFAGLKDETIYNLTVPAKLQTYMASGKPILAMMNGAGNALVEEAGCGIAVPASSPQQFVEGLKRLKEAGEFRRAEMGANGKTYYDRHFTKQMCLDNFVKLLEEV